MENVREEFLYTIRSMHLVVHILVLMVSGVIIASLASVHFFMVVAMGDALFNQASYEVVGRFATGAVAADLILITMTMPFHALTAAFLLSIPLTFQDMAGEGESS